MSFSLKEWVCISVWGAALTLGIATSRPACAADAPPPVQPAPAETVTPPAPPANASSEAQRLLEKQAADEKKLREEIVTQASAHFESGRALYAAFDYEGARQELEMAVRLDPSNEDARKMLVNVQDVLNRRRDRVHSAVAQLYGENRIQIQEKLVELDNRIDWGKRFIHEAQTSPELSLTERIRKYEQGLSAFERARELIKWMPIEISVETQSNEVNRLIAETRKAIKATQARLEDQDREAAAKLVEEQRANQRRFQEKKVNMMVDQAKAQFETGKFDEARELANKILELDPTNAEATSIVAMARERYHQKTRGWIDTEYKEQFDSNRERAERLNIPHSDYLIYPDNWREITQRSSQDVSGGRRTEELWKQDIRKKLTRRVSFEFVDTALEDAIQFLNAMAKVNIIIDPKIAAENANKTPITLRVSEMDVETALKWILRLAELEYDLRNQAVFITKKANLVSNVELEIYDIRDLTTAITDFPGPRVDLSSMADAAGAGAGGAVANPFDTTAATATRGAQDLSVLIKEKLLPAEFADPTTSIEEQSGKLIVMQRPEVQDRIRQLLRSFRETQTVQVLTQVRFVDVTDGFLEEIGVHFTGLDAAPNDRGVGNAATFGSQQQQPSRWGLFPAGGGSGPGTLPNDVKSAPANQFSNFQASPPFYTNPTTNQPVAILHPRLDSNFPNSGNANVGPANGPVGVRDQWFSNTFSSPVLFQGLTQNLLRANPLSSALGSSLQDNPAQGLMLQFRFLQNTQTSAVLQALRKDQTADQLLAPKLMQFNNQRAHIYVGQQRSYIGDYDVSGAVFDPVIKTLSLGIVMEVKPTVSNDKRYITMDVRPGTVIELTPPQIVYITNAGNNVNIGGGSVNLPVELPNLEVRSINTTVTLPDNGTMLFSGLIIDHKIDSKSGIPLLSDLPIIGRFFSNNHKERLRRNLLVLINARVVLFDEEEARL